MPLDSALFLLCKLLRKIIDRALERPLAIRIVVTLYQKTSRGTTSSRSKCRKMFMLYFYRRAKIKVVLLGLTIFGLFEPDEN